VKPTEHQPRRGPAEDSSWPEQLTARVVEPGDAPALHGYDVQRDLAAHYRFGEVVLVALAGEPPSEVAGRAFELAMTFASVITIAEAPTHAASLARLCGATPSGVLATGMLTLVEQVRAELEAHAPLLHWLDEPSADAPTCARAKHVGDRAGAKNLADALTRIGFSCRAPLPDPSVAALVLAVLHSVGLCRIDQLHAALCIARLAPLAAEAMASGAGTLRDYPLTLPPFQYEEPPA